MGKVSLYLIGTFVEDKIEGIVTVYFPNGSSRRIEYKNNEIIRYLD